MRFEGAQKKNRAPRRRGRVVLASAALAAALNGAAPHYRETESPVFEALQNLGGTLSNAARSFDYESYASGDIGINEDVIRGVVARQELGMDVSREVRVLGRLDLQSYASVLNEIYGPGEDVKPEEALAILRRVRSYWGEDSSAPTYYTGAAGTFRHTRGDEWVRGAFIDTLHNEQLRELLTDTLTTEERLALNFQTREDRQTVIEYIRSCGVENSILRDVMAMLPQRGEETAQLWVRRVVETALELQKQRGDGAFTVRRSGTQHFTPEQVEAAALDAEFGYEA